MITVSQAERLVRKIVDALGQPVSDTQAPKLAEEYAEVCRAASRRLEQCALMIEAGQSLHALQLAETPPPLLDLITVLAFRQSAEWRTFCQTHQLPWCEPFYDKFIRLLNSAYGNGVASDHPFYRDYRRAVLTGNDEKSLSILRVIARMNPSDQNTKEELQRVEERLLRTKLEKLREALATGNSATVQEQVAQIEVSGAAIPPSHPVWQQAQVIRCQDLLKKAAAWREKDGWQEAEPIVDEIHAVATEYNVQLPTADADAWSALEEWTTSKRSAYASDQDFKRAVAALEYEVQSVEARRERNGVPAAPEVKTHLDALTVKRHALSQFDAAPEADLLARASSAESWLQRQMQAGRRRKNLLVAVIAVVILAAIGASIPSMLKALQGRNFAGRMQSLETARHVSELESLLSHVPDALSNQPATTAAISQAQQFVAHEKEFKSAFDESMGRLDQFQSEGFRALEQVAPLRTQAGRALAQLAPEYQEAGQTALRAWDDKWQAFRNAALAGQLRAADHTAATLNSTNSPDSVRNALARLQSILAGMAPLRGAPPDLDRSLAERIQKLTGAANQWADTTQKWETARTALRSAQSVEEFLTRLDQLAQLPFAGGEQKDAVDEIDHLKISTETLLGQLLLPDDRTSWDILTNAATWRMALMPEHPTAEEKDLYFKLRDDKNMRNVFIYELVTNARPRNPFQTHAVFVQGALATDRAGQMSGLVYDPAEYHDTSRFVPMTYSDWDFTTFVKSNLAPECDSFDRIGLGDLIDPNTGNYQRPLLQWMDQLNRDDNSSPLFRAYVTLKLFALAGLRPGEWGLTWCPSAAHHLQELKDLGALDLKSGDWMVTVPVAKYHDSLQQYFARARQVPLEKQAQLLEQLAQQTCLAGFEYAGFIDIDGLPVLRRVNSAATEYWGWSSRSETATLLLRKSPGAAAVTALTAPLPFTPLFIFNGDRRQLLNDKARAVSYPAGQMQPILPPFFQGM